MVPGKGFVPAGVDPDTVPRMPVVAGASGLDPPSGPKVVLYVRNDSLTQIHDAVFVEGQIQDSGGFWGQNMGAACYSMPVGSRLVLLDRSATQPEASVVRELYAGGGQEPVSIWITVAKDGSIQQGVGVPAWWGAPLNC
jgi:phage gp46-like protein